MLTDRQKSILLSSAVAALKGQTGLLVNVDSYAIDIEHPDRYPCLIVLQPNDESYPTLKLSVVDFGLQLVIQAYQRMQDVYKANIVLDRLEFKSFKEALELA